MYYQMDLLEVCVKVGLGPVLAVVTVSQWEGR